MGEIPADSIPGDSRQEPHLSGHGPVRRVVVTIAFFGRKHRAPFARGCLAALFMVAARLAMPWPIHALMHYWRLGEEAQAAAVTHEIPGLDWSLTLGVVFLALLAALGLGDAMLRVQFAKFSIGTVRDLRAAALDAALRSGETSSARPGDMVARLVGDTARVKAGLKGFLVHVAPNGVLYLGVTVILLFLNLHLGLVFGLAGLGTALVTIASARVMHRKSKKYRRKEGHLADDIDRSLRLGTREADFAETNGSSGRSEASLTRIQSRATWVTHVLYGVAILACIWIGTRAIAAGALESPDMVLFLVYALIIRGPTVRLARQGSRLGTTIATASRVVKIFLRSPPDASSAISPSDSVTVASPGGIASGLPEPCKEVS